MARMPSLFVSDFGPFPAFERDAYTDALGMLGKALPKPKAILVMSGHWIAKDAFGVSSADRPETVHDYSGFPPEFYGFNYLCEGDPALAVRVVDALKAGGIAASENPVRGLDHGAWVPLSRLYPLADVPVVQIAVPFDDPKKAFEIGRALASLREEGVMPVGAGALSHNLKLALAHAKDDEPDDWALEFDAWISRAIERGEIGALLDYRSRAPHAALAAPTQEHFNPFFFSLGAAAGDPAKEIHRSVRNANGLMRIYRFG